MTRLSNISHVLTPVALNWISEPLNYHICIYLLLFNIGIVHIVEIASCTPNSALSVPWSLMTLLTRRPKGPGHQQQLYGFGFPQLIKCHGVHV